MTWDCVSTSEQIGITEASDVLTYEMIEDGPQVALEESTFQRIVNQPFAVRLNEFVQQLIGAMKRIASWATPGFPARRLLQCD